MIMAFSDAHWKVKLIFGKKIGIIYKQLMVLDVNHSDFNILLVATHKNHAIAEIRLGMACFKLSKLIQGQYMIDDMGLI
jgi:hypothetical protein